MKGLPKRKQTIRAVVFVLTDFFFFFRMPINIFNKRRRRDKFIREYYLNRPSSDSDSKGKKKDRASEISSKK